MDNTLSNLFSLPDEVIAKIFNYVGDPRVSATSHKFHQVFEYFAILLFHDYGAQPFLKKFVNKINDNLLDTSLKKVKALYSTLYNFDALTARVI